MREVDIKSDITDCLFERRKAPLGVNQLLSECADRARRFGVSFYIRKMDADVGSFVLADPTVCLEALEQALTVMSLQGCYPIGISIRQRKHRFEGECVVVILKSEESPGVFSGGADGLRLADQMRRLRIWLRESGLRWSEELGLAGGISLRLVFEASMPLLDEKLSW